MSSFTVLGIISGTSHDGIDVATVDFVLRPDGVLAGTVSYIDSTPYDPALRDRLLRALPPAAPGLGEACALDTLIGQAFAAAAADAIDQAGPVDLICSHGQTVYHWTEGSPSHEACRNATQPALSVLGTLQIGQPAWIAERTGVPVVADVRARDVVAGGQGAPIVAVMDTMLLAGLPGRPGALNLGGIANITVPRGGDAGPVAYDTGPANALIDAAAIRATGGRLRYDEDGRLAAAGRVDDDLLARLLAEPYYALTPPKTTGKELFHAGYLEAALGSSAPADADVVATVTALTAETVAAEVRRHGIDTLVVSGGGTANPTLMAMLRARLPGVRIAPSDEFGAPAAAKEAIAFALVGWLTAHGLPGNAPSSTGAAGGRVLGAIVPGAQPLRLPDPLPEAPRLLRLAGRSG